MEEATCPCPVFSHYLILHLIISSILFFVAFIKVLMVPPFQSEDFILIGCVFASCILIAVMVEGFKYCLNFILRKCGVSEETRCRTELIIGLGGITLCAVVPKVLVIFVNEMDINTLIYLIYTLHFSISILSFTFLSNPKIHHFNYNQMKKCEGYTIFGLFIGYVGVFLILLSVGVTEKPNPERVIATYSSFGIVGLVSILEFFTVCVLPIKLRSEEEVLRMEEKKPEGLEPEEEPIEDNDSESFNDAFMRFYLLVTILLLIFGFFLIIHTGKNGLAVLSGAVCLAICQVVRWWSNSLGTERKLELWCRKLKIGFSGIAICGFVPRIGIYFVGWNFEIIVLMFFITLVTACSFYYLFVHGYRKVCNLNYDKYCSSIIYIIIVKLLLWFLAIRIALIYDPGFQRTMLIHTQIGLFFMSLGSSVDLLVVMMGGVYLRDVPEVKEEEADLEQGKDVIKKRVTIRIFCPLCKKSYSETTNIPRILRECGDTICETCADFLLKKRNHVKCPVCTIPTVVRGPASTLMKNFAIFDLMERVE